MTIRDVAKLAGVSDATVSRVLNNNPKVTDETRAHVMAVIEQTGYRPNLLGRNLRRSKTGNILVLQPSVANDFYSQIIRGIEDIARKQGYYVLICTTNANPDTEEHYLSLLKNRLADGVICLASELPPQELKSISRHYPFVFCSEYQSGLAVPTVTIDNKQAGMDAVNHLLSLGRRNIAFAGGPQKYLSARLRREGYLAALHAAGITPPEEYMQITSYSYNGGLRVCDRIMRLKNPPDAVFASSDTIAVGIVRRLAQLGLEAGRDISVIGFDDIAVASVYNPAISTISQPRRDIGRTAMELLLKRIASEKAEPEFIVFPHNLVIRETTAPVQP